MKRHVTRPTPARTIERIPTRPPATRLTAVAALALVVLVLVAYFPALQGGFVWDDDAYVSRNPVLHGLDGLWRIWFDPSATPQYYPLTFTSFWLEVRLWGLRPFGFHLVNVLLHALNAVLLWRLLLRLAVPGAWLAAALFAVHPAHVESVAWITERKNVLSGAFAFGSALCFLRWFATTRSADRRWYAASLLLFAAALLGKTAVCFLPAALLLALWWKRGMPSTRDVSALAPFFALALAFAGVTAWLEHYHVGAHGEDWSHSWVERVLIAGRALWFYGAKLVWPPPLIFNYPAWRIDAASPWQYLFPAGAAAVFAALLWFRHRIGRGPLAAMALFAGGLLPVLGFVDFYAMRYSYVADHFLYLPSIGVLALAAAGVAALSAAWVRNALAALLIVACVGLTQQQSRVYRDLETFWRDILAKNPGSWLAHNNLGSFHFENGALDEATAHWREAMRLDSRRGEIHGNLGRAAMARGRLDEAETFLRQAVALAPTHTAERLNLGVVLTRQGRNAEAAAEYEASLRLQPDVPSIHNDLGSALAALGRLDEAIHHYRAALALDAGDAKVHSNLGLALAAQGEVDEAVRHYAEAIRLAPDMAEARNNYAISLEDLGRQDEAVEQYEAVVRLAPMTAEAHYNLAAALAKLGRRDDAAAEYRRALEVRPDFAAAARALARLEKD